MGAVFIVTKDKKQLAKVSLTGNTFVAGRSHDCNLPLDETLASRRHIEVTFVRGAYWIRDCGSRNGTLVNGEKIADNYELKDGDEVEIGSTRLKFAWDKSRQDEEQDEDKTRAASFADAGKKLPGQQVVEKKNKGNFQVKARVVDGPLAGGVFRNWEGPLTIGRGLENHVVLLDDAVSTGHARIVQEGESYFIEDLKSSNGTFLDGVKVQKTKLSDGQKIKVGISTLVFEMVDLQKQRKTFKIALITVASIAVVALAAKLLQPADIAGQHIAMAQSYAAKNDWAKAKDEYEAAIKIDPNRTEAKRGVEAAKEAIEAGELLKMADDEASAENYDKAKELCYRVQRNFPNNPRAAELVAVIKSIENAKIAFSARNWAAAKSLLEKAQDKYPQSKLIRLRLDEAQHELVAEGNLSQAKNALLHEQSQLAQPLLQSIPTDSVYYTEARQMLDQIMKDRAVADYLTKAGTYYRDGNIPEALKVLSAGLQQAPDNTTLIARQERIRQMETLIARLDTAEAAGTTDDVDTLLANRDVCEKIIGLEEDTLNTLRKRAQTSEAGINARLVQLSHDYVAKATSLVQAGNRKEALQAYDLAIKANPNSTEAAGPREDLFQKIVADCKELYQKGIVHESLQQSDQARQAFKQILAIGIPGERYYDLAGRKLKTLGQ